MKTNSGIIFLLLISSNYAQDLQDIYELNLNHQQAVDQLNKEEKMNKLQTKLGRENQEAENAKILEIVILIQEGNIPEKVKVLNTIYRIQKVNGRNLTIYDTTYKQGNEEEGEKNRVRIILDPYPEFSMTMSDWWIKSLEWKGDIELSKLTHYRFWGNGENYRLIQRSSVSSVDFRDTRENDSL